MMTSARILLIEDNMEISDYNAEYLEKVGYLVSAAATLAEARIKLETFHPDLMVLDIMLPDGSGIDFCKEVRTVTTCPVLFLTNLTDVNQIVKGLRAGGDDYMIKPYRMEELLARIEAHLRRAALASSIRMTVGKDVLMLDTRSQRACLNDRDLLLKPKECQILGYLMQNRNRYVSADELYAEIWGMSSNEDVRTVFVHISNIRTKLKSVNRKGNIAIGKSKLKGYRLVSGEGQTWESL